MKIGGRPISTILSAPFHKQHYIAAANMLSVYERPLEMFVRYLTASGIYPMEIRAKSPLGSLDLTAYSADDVLSVNEIFCRQDYLCDPTVRVVVDFGSNIGISAAYFLSRNPTAFAYLYEPLPQNTTRLKHNLRFSEGRYELIEAAVGLEDGTAEFGWEPSGRYGGIGQETGNYIKVACKDSNTVLSGIIAKHGQIDVLKVDIETLEKQVVERIPEELRHRIGSIFAEYRFPNNPLRNTHSMRQYGSVAQFKRL